MTARFEAHPVQAVRAPAPQPVVCGAVMPGGGMVDASAIPAI